MNSSSSDEKGLVMLPGPANWSEDEAEDNPHDQNEEEMSDESSEDTTDEEQKNDRVRARRLCQPNLGTIEDMRAIAIARGGTCLSNVYEGFNVHLKWRCSDGHEWMATPKNVSGHRSWCPGCNGNVGEEIVRATMREAFPGKTFDRTRREEWLGRLELDGYDSELKLAFEYQGKQHFDHVPHFHRGDGQFESQQLRDTRKRELCKQNGVILLEVPYTIKTNDIRLAVRQMLIDSKFDIADAIGSDDAFYNTCRASPFRNQQLAFAKEIANVKGGICNATRCMGYDFKMSFTCRDNHEFKASLQDINQKRSRGPRFCPECGGTRKKTDDEIRACVEGVGYKLISIAREVIGGKDRSRPTVQCPANHAPYPATLDSLVRKDKTLKRGCKDCGKIAQGKSQRSDISDWLKKTGFSVIGEYQGGAKPSTWKCPKEHVFSATFVALKQRKHLCRLCLLAGDK